MLNFRGQGQFAPHSQHAATSDALADSSGQHTSQVLAAGSLLLLVPPCCPALLHSYGIGLTPERFKLTKGLSWGTITPMPGLLLTGQDTVGNGVVLAWKSGILAAQIAGGVLVGATYG